MSKIQQVKNSRNCLDFVVIATKSICIRSSFVRLRQRFNLMVGFVNKHWVNLAELNWKKYSLKIFINMPCILIFLSELQSQMGVITISEQIDGSDYRPDCATVMMSTTRTRLEKIFLIADCIADFLSQQEKKDKNKTFQYISVSVQNIK